MTAPTFSKIEQEAIVLAAVWAMIDGMVNREFVEEPILTRPTNLWFKSSSHKRLFNVLLTDFLSQPQKKGKSPIPFGLQRPTEDAPPSSRTYLHYLAEIARDPQIGSDTSNLLAVVREFANWLDAECHCEGVWLSGLDINLDMRVPRIWVFQMAGDMGKHNFSRLEGRIRQIKIMLSDHGYPDVDEGMIYRELEVFYEWFHSHLFSYHASTIAEFLNNIRWALFAYLRPEFLRAYRTDDRAEGMYLFDVPTTITNSLAVGMYWELMNSVRREPYFPVFEVSPSLKSDF